jgi:cell division protein FtsL
MSKARFNLNRIIIDDMFAHNKLLLLLLALIALTGAGVVWITEDSRHLIGEQRRLAREIASLENDYTNLQLEENSQSERNKIEAEARSLGLKTLNKEQEIILSDKYR